jgi:CDP-paratose 2-epimerase
VSLLELTRLCERATGNQLEIQSTAANRPGDIPVYISNNSTITGRLGWSPQIDVETLVGDYVAWIKENEKELRPIFSE